MVQKTFFPIFESAARSPDPCARKHGGNAQSQAAFKRAEASADSKKEQLYQAILNSRIEGMTSKELLRRMRIQWDRPEIGLNHFSGRLTTLVAEGRIVDSGRRREEATVWVASSVMLQNGQGVA